MNFRGFVFGLCALIAVLLATRVDAAVQQYNGALGSPAVDPAFDAATSALLKQFIDFDNDGLTSETAIPPYQYLPQGVILSNLDARDVTPNPWTHSPPFGAWHSGFSNPILTPYSFTFTSPVASFGMFANDLEAVLNVTVHTTSGIESFTIPVQGGANITQFHGFAASSNIITGIDFMSSDYHIIDDVQFGAVPEPSAAAILALAGITCTCRRRHASSRR